MQRRKKEIKPKPTVGGPRKCAGGQNRPALAAAPGSPVPARPLGPAGPHRAPSTPRAEPVQPPQLRAALQPSAEARVQAQRGCPLRSAFRRWEERRAVRTGNLIGEEAAAGVVRGRGSLLQLVLLLEGGGALPSPPPPPPPSPPSPRQSPARGCGKWRDPRGERQGRRQAQSALFLFGRPQGKSIFHGAPDVHDGGVCSDAP